MFPSLLIVILFPDTSILHTEGWTFVCSDSVFSTAVQPLEWGRDQEEDVYVYIPGADRLGRLNNRDLRRLKLNEEAEFDRRCYVNKFHKVYVRFTSTGPGVLERLKQDLVDALRKHQANKDKLKLQDPLGFWIKVRCICSTKFENVAAETLWIAALSVSS